MVFALTGVVNSRRILSYVPDADGFRQLLRLVRSWAKRRQVYGAKAGFLAGVHWAALAARVRVGYVSIYVFQIFGDTHGEMHVSIR